MSEEPLLDAELPAPRFRSLSLRALALCALGVTLTTTCCTRQTPAGQHTVAEYRANAALRREEFARCANDPGSLGETPDCINAREASRVEDIGSVRDTPPIHLPTPTQH
jgi:hypothetical protein